MSHRHEINSILKQVQGWPAEEREALAMELLRSAPSAAGERRPSLGALLGIANPTGRAFTDEEVDDLRFQALKEKFQL
jgi:hypothetical protein